jgi:hypothetical protein
MLLAISCLHRVLLQYNTTVAWILLNNAAALSDPKKQIADNTQLAINCPSGVWSGVYGVHRNWNEANAMVAAPAEFTCPNSEFATQFLIKPSKVCRSTQQLHFIL